MTAEFPGGYTVLEATGYWKPDEAPSTMREDSRIIAILLRPMPERKSGGSPGCTGSFFFRNPYWSRYRPRMRNSSMQFPMKNSLDKFALA